MWSFMSCSSFCIFYTGSDDFFPTRWVMISYYILSILCSKWVLSYESYSMVCIIFSLFTWDSSTLLCIVVMNPEVWIWFSHFWVWDEAAGVTTSSIYVDMVFTSFLIVSIYSSWNVESYLLIVLVVLATLSSNSWCLYSTCFLNSVIYCKLEDCSWKVFLTWDSISNCWR